jgi:hypothetical protein
MARVLFVFLWVSVFCSLAYFSLPNYDMSERIDATLPRTIETKNVSRLWFSPAGDLVAYGLDGIHLTVQVWASGSGSLLHERTLELTSPPKTAAPTFAVSEDASQIAWISPAGVHVEALFGSAPGAEPAEHPLRRRIEISSLALVGVANLAMLYRDGNLELWDLAKGGVIASKNLGITEPCPLLGKGSYLATYSRFSHDAFVLDTGLGDRLSLIENSRYASAILAVALSAQGRLAISLGDQMQEQGVAVQAPGGIQALAFYDLSRVFAGGDFGGIFLLGRKDPMVQAASSGPGTSVLAATESLLAYGTSRRIKLSSYHLLQIRTYRGLSQPSVWLTIALLGLLSPIAIPLLRVVFRMLFRRRPRLPESDAEPPIPADDDTIPNLLVEACQNGDCVLYAGAGLSAQAGLPLWNTAVRELATWAAGESSIPPEAAAAAFDELSRGQTSAAADRIAAALAGHEQALVNHLRSQYRTGADLPAAHHLIKQIDFPALITTTFDNLLDRTFPYSGGRVYTAQSCASLERAAARRDFFLLKPFGDLDEPDTIRLGPAQCAEAIEANPACPDFIEQLLQLRTFLFLGASLEGMEQDLSLITLHAPIERKHYAFVAVQEGDASKEASERLRDRYGIHLLPYAPTAPTHPELVDFLNRLLTAMRESTSTRQHLTAVENS